MILKCVRKEPLIQVQQFFLARFDELPGNWVTFSVTTRTYTEEIKTSL